MVQSKSARKAWKDPLKNLLTLEEPGKPFLFDTDRAFVQEVSSRHSVKALVEGLKGKSEAQAREAFLAFGQKAMALSIELADTKFMDRTGQMIEKVYQQTGVSFPHRFERYVEHCLLGCRPLDRWNITKATPQELVLQISGCGVLQLQKDAGLGYAGLPCQALDTAAFDVAARKTGDALSYKLDKTLPKDGMCQFCISAKGK